MTNSILIDDEDYEKLDGTKCPKCGYPVAVEAWLRVCYNCGWYEGEDEE